LSIKDSIVKKGVKEGPLLLVGRGRKVLITLAGAPQILPLNVVKAADRPGKMGLTVADAIVQPVYVRINRVKVDHTGLQQLPALPDRAHGDFEVVVQDLQLFRPSLTFFVLVDDIHNELVLTGAETAVIVVVVGQKGTSAAPLWKLEWLGLLSILLQHLQQHRMTDHSAVTDHVLIDFGAELHQLLHHIHPVTHTSVEEWSTSTMVSLVDIGAYDQYHIPRRSKTTVSGDVS